jgi:hypothetical protein
MNTVLRFLSAVPLYPEISEQTRIEENVSLVDAVRSGVFTALHPVSIAFIVISVLFIAAAVFVIITGKKAGK